MRQKFRVGARKSARERESEKNMVGADTESGGKLL